MNGKIYIIKNDLNNKVYIGKTLLPSINDRFKEHLKDAPRRNFEKRPLYRAINKYGAKHFYIELLEECDMSILSEREIYWINYYSSYSKGYNATIGGEGKPLYDIQDRSNIIKLFNEGKLIKEIAKIYECDRDTVSRILLNEGIDTNKNKIARNKQTYKKVRVFYNNKIKDFESQTAAAKWIVEDQQLSKGKIDNVAGTIGRACKGLRSSAYGYIWEYI